MQTQLTGSVQVNYTDPSFADLFEPEKELQLFNDFLTPEFFQEPFTTDIVKCNSVVSPNIASESESRGENPSLASSFSDGANSDAQFHPTPGGAGCPSLTLSPESVFDVSPDGRAAHEQAAQFGDFVGADHGDLRMNETAPLLFPELPHQAAAHPVSMSAQPSPEISHSIPGGSYPIVMTRVAKSSTDEARLRRARNTESARRSRTRNKKRVSELESLVDLLTRENHELRNRLSKLES